MRVHGSTAVVVVAFVLAALLIYWLLSNLERVSIEGHTGYAAEARNNNLLAAEKLLAALGLTPRSFASLDHLPPVSTTLLLPVSRRQLSLARSDEIGAWVESGGHLLVVAAPSDEKGSNDPLLERFDVRGEYHEGAGDESEPTKVFVAGMSKPLNVSFSAESSLSTQARALVRNEFGVHAVSLNVGRGRLTVLSDYGFVVNRQIEDNDNAAFLWYLVTLEPFKSVWLIYGSDPVSLWQRVIGVAWQTMISCAVLCLLIFWSVVKRFGPLLPGVAPARRKLLEHIEASGRFLWKHGQAAALIDDLRQSLLHSMEFSHPGWVASPDLAQRLAKVSGLNADVVQRALEVDVVKDQHNFVQTIKILEIIRQQL
jgi:hypothetical protein